MHKSGPDAIGSLLLGLYDERGVLASVGVIGAFPMATRKALFRRCSRWSPTFDGHPWDWAAHEQGERTPRKNEASRWNAGKDLSFVPLRPERVVEVRYDYMEGVRFRHTAQFVRWRPDREPASCTYEQLEQPVTFDLAEVLGLPQVAGELAAGGGDLLAAGVAHGAGHPRRLHPAHELVLHRRGRGVPLAARRRVERDQVDVHPLGADLLAQHLAEQVGAPRLVVDVADQRVLDRHPAPGGRGVAAGGGQHLVDLPPVVDRAPGCRAARRRGCAGRRRA